MLTDACADLSSTLGSQRRRPSHWHVINVVRNREMLEHLITPPTRSTPASIRGPAHGSHICLSAETADVVQ